MPSEGGSFKATSFEMSPVVLGAAALVVEGLEKRDIVASAGKTRVAVI
jgi:hypothetical protein